MTTPAQLQDSIYCMSSFVGLHAVSGVGKDTLASTFVSRLHTPDQPLLHLKMALALRAMVYHMHDLDPDRMMDKTYEQEHGVTQLLIDTAKSQGPRPLFFEHTLMWGIRCALRLVASRVSGRMFRVVLSDVRQQDEADLVKRHGVLVHLTRAGVEREEQELDRILDRHDCTYTMHLNNAPDETAMLRYHYANSLNLLDMCSHDLLTKMPYVVPLSEGTLPRTDTPYLIPYVHQQVRMLNPHLFA